MSVMKDETCPKCDVTYGWTLRYCNDVRCDADDMKDHLHATCACCQYGTIVPCSDAGN